MAVALGGGDESAFGQWAYAWSPAVPPSPNPVEHIPFLVGRPANGLPAKEIVVEMDQRAAHNYWLVFNECEHQLQCATSPQDAARFYHDQVLDLLYNQGADSDAELIVGGSNAHPCGIQWLADFVTFYEANYGPMPRVGWHFHLYPEIRPAHWPGGCGGDWIYDDTLFPSPGTAFQLWRDHAQAALAFVSQYGKSDDQIWFTEMGCLNYGFHQVQQPVCQAEGFMQNYASQILAWLNNEGRVVTRYAWYTNWDNKYWEVTKLLDSAGGPWQFSSLGWFYSQITPAASVSMGSITTSSNP